QARLARRERSRGASVCQGELQRYLPSLPPGRNLGGDSLLAAVLDDDLSRAPQYSNLKPVACITQAGSLHREYLSRAYKHPAVMGYVRGESGKRVRIQSRRVGRRRADRATCPVPGAIRRPSHSEARHGQDRRCGAISRKLAEATCWRDRDESARANR